MGALKLAEKLDKKRVQDHLQSNLPDTLTIKNFPGPVAFTIGESAFVAALVTVNGKRINTMPWAHGFGMSWVMILIMLSGIGLIIYAVVAIPKQKKIVEQVETELEKLV